jgi:hypothetical protein
MLRCLVLTRAKWRNIPEDTILHSHRRENLKSYTPEGWLMTLSTGVLNGLNECNAGIVWLSLNISSARQAVLGLL